LKPRYFVVAVAVLLIACGVSAHAKAADTTDPDPARFENEIKAFEASDRQNAVPPHAILFVGSSSVRLWQTAEGFPGLPVINRGFGGAHESDVNYYMDRIVLKYKPRVIVYYAGDNDIAAGKSPQRVFDDFRKFIDKAHTALPNTEIVYLSIKPSLSRWKMWPEMQETNALVKQSVANDSLVTYVDTGPPMLGDDGKPRPDIFRDDGLHMNATGYAIWNKILMPILERELAAH
jgi:lysophospholipase L1-like esterase